MTGTSDRLAPDLAAGIRPWQRLLASLVCAACMVLGSPDVSWWWLGLVGWVPWLYAIEGLGPKKAFWYGWLTGTITVFWGFIWLTELLDKFAGFGLPMRLFIHLLFAAFQGLQWAVPAAAIVWLRRRTGRDVLLLAPLCWVAGEALLPHVFPSYLALMWAYEPRWLQLAEIGGVTTVGLAQLAINAGLYVLLRDYIARGMVSRAAAATFAGFLIGTPLYGTIRMAQVDAVIADSPKVKIGVVQGNFGIYEWSRNKYKYGILERMQAESGRLEAEGAQLLLWGETGYPFSYTLPRKGGHDLPVGHPKRVRRTFTAPLIFGIVTEDKAVSPYAWNTAMVLERDQSLGDTYDKVFPLYFGEYVPLVDPEWYRKMVPAASYINPGEKPGVLRADDMRFGPLICYEDILPRFARETAAGGIHAFVNLTNDSWFGKSKEQSQHLGLAVLRTIENRRALVRSVNAGPSVYVDPNGRVIHQTEVTDPDNAEAPLAATGFVAEVPLIDLDYLTPYTRTGELFNGLVVLLLIGIGIRGPRRFR
ncbi:MAG: apolipoprotein N-acyltransferase [Nannocystis sp.]|nr:apolipoprotein N-acyltransferase [Nannocystis sp.]MBA3546339.1 apolipoprotein N-acyltransferase [Nannocystis sp.]